VIEIASNDGYLLQYFQRRGVPVLGIEPARNVAAAAQARGIPTLVRFFGLQAARELAAEGRDADLVVGNNVLAHTPALVDFVEGLAAVLRPQGIVTLEFPHLVRLVAENQFDTIYHEHFSYFSFTAVSRVLAAHGLEVFDVEELATHGGSLRLFAQRAGDGRHPIAARGAALLEREAALGIESLDYYRAFAARVRETKWKLVEFLIGERRRGRTIVGYGAPAKGNTLLNYCGVRGDLLDYTVDRSPHKQGLYLPGTRIPIHSPERIRATRPDWVLILPWNLKHEVMAQMADVRSWGGRFLVAIPEVTVEP
jgi:SAM-dependent methyltransferase